MADLNELSEIVLHVRDLPAQLAFYRDLLGLPVKSAAGLPLARAELNTGACTLVLDASLTPGPATNRTRFIFRVPDLTRRPPGFDSARGTPGPDLRTGSRLAGLRRQRPRRQPVQPANQCQRRAGHHHNDDHHHHQRAALLQPARVDGLSNRRCNTDFSRTPASTLNPASSGPRTWTTRPSGQSGWRFPRKDWRR